MRQFTNRDLQCDFENEFWDEAECGWKYSQAILALISSPSDTVRMTRVKVASPANVGTNYWKKDNTYSPGKYLTFNRLFKSFLYALARLLLVLSGFLDQKFGKENLRILA